MVKVVYRMAVANSDENEQNIKVDALWRKLQDGDGLSAEMATEVKRNIKDKATLLRIIDSLESQNKAMFIKKDQNLIIL